MSEIIKNLEKLSPAEEILEGTFTSSFFKEQDGDNQLMVCIENADTIEYAEKCIEHFNNMPDNMIDTICKGVLKSAEYGGMNEDFELPELENIRDILNYCWFCRLIVCPPESEEIFYCVEGEGDWGEVVGFTVCGNKVLYVGCDFELPYGESDEFYRDFDGNCI